MNILEGHQAVTLDQKCHEGDLIASPLGLSKADARHIGCSVYDLYFTFGERVFRKRSVANHDDLDNNPNATNDTIKSASNTMDNRGINIAGKATNPKDAIATDKLPLHLVSSLVKAYQSIAHFLGNVKYGAWNYRGAGVRYSIYKSALDRHMDAWWEGEEYDPVDGTPHLANALCCINILIEGIYTKGSIDDRPPSRCKQLAEVRAEFEALMPKIRERYKDKTPKHWTIEDTNPTQ